MTEKISAMAAPRCALDVWKYVHRGNAHRINQPINHPTFGGRYAEGTGPPRFTLARISTPFPASSISHRSHPPSLSSLSSAFASLPTSSPALLPVSSSPFTDDDGVCVYRRQSPSTEGFSRFFSPRVYPTPEASRDGGGDGGGHPEGAAVGIGTQPRQFSYRTT